MAGLSVWAQRHISRIEENFKQADKDNSGTLQLSEVIQVLRNSGFKGSDEEAKKIFSEIDTDKNQVVSRVEFKNAMSKVPKIDFKTLVMRRSFKHLDADGSGFLTRDEILAAATNECGLDVKAEMISDMLLALIKDDDKKINYDEFLDIWGRRSNGEILRDIFKRLDVDKSGTLSKQELIEGIKSDEELKLCGNKLSSMLITWCKGEDNSLKYEDFIRAYESAK
ncbi:CPK [Mytilus coruscus]|uniref:Sulfhydryl light chain n=1 Tax=Mytilus coruscus TaxID=42192 RepID=A0A6J8E118_MYTCO|nr:CPK [Mytilus coruscus]